MFKFSRPMCSVTIGKYIFALEILVHSKVFSITLVATKVHVILRSFIVLTWMCDTIVSVACDIME